MLMAKEKKSNECRKIKVEKKPILYHGPSRSPKVIDPYSATS